MNQADNSVEVVNVSKTFTQTGVGALEVLRDVSFTCHAGEFVSIVGASGCGKSTLLRVIDGLSTPSSGSVRVGGNIQTSPGRDVSFVFQQDNLLPWRTVLENASYGLTLRRVGRKSADAEARRLLQMVGLAGFESHYPHELSGGMRQRVNLARALAVNPSVLLMDEPFAALDSQTREIMQAELLRIWDAAQKTVLFVTHQIDEAVYLSDRVVVLTVRPGRIKAMIEIDLPRPRNLEVKRTAEFAAYTDQIWRLIEHEVRESMELELADALQLRQ